MFQLALILLQVGQAGRKEMVFIAIILHLQNNRLVFFLEQSMGG
jgi:hypothetical protein